MVEFVCKLLDTHSSVYAVKVSTCHKNVSQIPRLASLIALIMQLHGSCLPPNHITAELTLNVTQETKYLHGKMLANRFFTLLKGSFDTSWEAKGSDPRD